MAFMEASSLGGRGWRYNPKRGVFENGRKRYGFGDAIMATLKRADTVRGELLMREAIPQRS